MFACAQAKPRVLLGPSLRHSKKRESLKAVSGAPDLAASGTAGELDVEMRYIRWLYAVSSQGALLGFTAQPAHSGKHKTPLRFLLNG